MRIISSNWIFLVAVNNAWRIHELSCLRKRRKKEKIHSAKCQTIRERFVNTSLKYCHTKKARTCADFTYDSFAKILFGIFIHSFVWASHNVVKRKNKNNFNKCLLSFVTFLRYKCYCPFYFVSFDFIISRFIYIVMNKTEYRPTHTKKKENS